MTGESAGNGVGLDVHLGIGDMSGRVVPAWKFGASITAMNERYPC